MPIPMPRRLDAETEMGIIYISAGGSPSRRISQVYDEKDHLEVSLYSRACKEPCVSRWSVVVIHRTDVPVVLENAGKPEPRIAQQTRVL